MSLVEEIIEQVTRRLRELGPAIEARELAKIDIMVGINTNARRVHHVHVQPQYTYDAIDTRRPA